VLVKALNLFLFLFIWAFIWYMPVPPKKTGWKKPARVISLLLGLFIFFLIQFLQPPLSVFTYVLVFLRIFVAFVESAFTVKHVDSEETHTKGSGYYYYYRHSRFPWKISAKIRGRLVGVLFLAYLLAVSGFIAFWQFQRVANASYFSNFIHTGSGPPFNSEIPDGMVRLVTEELAVSIARRHMSEFGSNTQILGCHITKTPEGKLVWVAVIGSTNVIAENYVKGFMVIDATEPLAPPKILKKEFKVGEGLWFDHNIHYSSYMKGMSKRYGIAYVTWNSETNEPVYVVTRYNVGFDLIRRYETPIVYDKKRGSYPQAENLQQIPLWITQVYDENWLEEMINEMGDFRRGASFDYLAGGFFMVYSAQP